MEMRKAALPPICRAALKALALVATFFIVGAAPALAAPAKVLVFTGTAGTPNASSADIATAIQSLGTTGQFTADVTSSASDINATKLADYRAVVFVNSSGNVLDATQETALTDYVNTGGGFVGIGETALLESGGATFFNTLLGLGATRTTGTATSSTQDIEFLDRVHPSTRALPQTATDTDTWYQWGTNPTGTVQTVARVRIGGIAGPDGKSTTNDATAPRQGSAQNAVQPQGDRAASWCRDVQQGRSFYTEMGASSASIADTNIRKHVTGAVQWAAGLVRGGCKATINSNYTATRVTPVQSGAVNTYYGELTKSALADDGRVFYGGRAICYQGYTQILAWEATNTGLGCGTIHVWDPRVAGTNNQNPDKIAAVANLSVWGAHGSSPEYGQNATSEAGLVGMVLDPDFTKGRPYMYVQYYPYWGGEQGKDTNPKLGTGFVGLNPPGGRLTYKGEKRISRFTYDNSTKTFVPGSEKVIFSYTSPVYNCCHNGAGMAFDSKGNLYVTNGDSTPNGTSANGSNNLSNNNTGGYTNPDPHFTLPCPGAAPTTHCGDTPADQRPADTGNLISYGDARSTSGNTNVYEGKIIRIKPLADPGGTPGIGSTYTIPPADSPNGGNLFAPDSQAVTDGKAKPEIFAMGVRSTYTIHIDKKTDAITTAWIGPDQSNQDSIWGPAKTENATMMNGSGNWGWPFCQGGNRWDYRVKTPSLGGGGAAAFPTTLDPEAVGGGADGQTGAFFDCRGPVANNSPYNTGIKTLPAPKPVNLWYGPQGGCYGYGKNANGVGLYPAATNPAGLANSTPWDPATQTGIYRQCPWLGSGGSQAPIDGGIYRRPAGDKPDAWPSYWDGRWFLMDFASATNIRHALLMDPATQFNGGQPTSADNLLGIIPSSLIGGTRPVFMDFGSDGALYIGSYAGSYYAVVNSNMGVWRVAYTGGGDTPGSDPKAVVPAVGSKVAFNIGKSGGVSYTWDFGDGTPKVTTTDSSVDHTYDTKGAKTATLTVTYADGATDSKTVQTADVQQPLFTNTNADVQANVPLVLAITLGQPATFGTFAPSQDKDYTASTTASVISTAGSAQLSVSDRSATAPGHLVNADYTLPSTLQARASSTKGTGGVFADVGPGTTPTALLSYATAATDSAVTLDFKQHIGASDALRAGKYSKTLTFTLSTTTP